MNSHLLVQIKALEAIHTKALNNGDAKIAMWATNELIDLYAQKWGLPTIITEEII